MILDAPPALTDFQVSYNGLTMGAGTGIEIKPPLPAIGLMAVRNMDVARVWGPGSTSGPDFADTSTIDLVLDVQAQSEAEFADLVLQLRAATGVQKVSHPLWVKIPGQELVGVLAKVNGRPIPIDLTWGALVEITVTFRTVTPGWFSPAASVSLVSDAGGSGGLVFPLFAPASGVLVEPGALDFGLTAHSGSSVVVRNVGNSPCWPVVVVSGPLTWFTVDVGSHEVRWDGVVAAGQAVTLDWSTGTALLGGVPRSVNVTSKDFAPIPGTMPGQDNPTTITFASNGGSCVVSTADVWDAEGN